VNSSPLKWLGTAAIAALVAIPILGLAMAALDRQPDPITGAVSPLFQVSAGVGELLLRSVLLSAFVALGSGIVGTWLAWVEHRTRMLGAWAIATLLPLAMPSYLVAATMRSSLSPGGWIGDRLGLPHMTGFSTAVIVLVVVTAPLVQLIVGASLKNASAVEEEAALVLGSSPIRVFWDITWPRLRPAIGFSCLISLLYAISDFGAVAVLDVPVLTWRLYLAVENQDVARASVLGAATLVALLPMFFAARALRGGVQRVGVANARPVQPYQPSRLAVCATVLSVFTIVGLGVVLPVGTLLIWVWDGMSRSLEFVSPWGAITDTTIVALGGMLFTVGLASLPAYAVAEEERKGQGKSWVEDGVYLTSALPGVLLALGLIVAAVRFTRPFGVEVYGVVLASGALLMVGYATRFVAEVFAPLRVAFGAIDQRQVESARVLGAGAWKRFRTVLLPSIAPGVVVACLIGFNAIVKELPVTLLLGGATGLKTLSFRVWDRYNEALWHDAGLAGLWLVALALISAVLTIRWRKNA